MKKIPVMISLLLLSIILSGCGSGQRANPTASPSPAASTATNPPPPTRTATPMPTKTQEPVVFQAQHGPLKIVRYGFQSSLMDWKSGEGYRLLVLWLESVDGAYADGGELMEDSETAYVTGNDRSTTFRGICCLAEGDLVVGFITPSTASSFTLYWPGNEPIALTKPQ